MRFVVGQRVWRTLIAQGKRPRREVEGVVVAVVNAGQDIVDAIHVVREASPGLAKPDGAWGFRDHESYVVRCGSKNYWPRVSSLRPADEETKLSGNHQIQVDAALAVCEGFSPASAEVVRNELSRLRAELARRTA